MKTKKWVEAKKNAYDGDDWGDYDEFDEYGADAAPPPPAVPSGFRQPGQALDQPSRSFTDPTQKPLPRPERRNSFEAGEEQRAFSATYPQPAYSQAPTQPYHVDGPPEDVRQPAYRQASGAESQASDTPQNRRDFSASALPPPLVTRTSTEGPIAASPTNTSKPLPFIRPADIYKRAEEERHSLEKERPPQQPAPSVPGMDSDFWSSGPQLGDLTAQSHVHAPPADPGFRAAVDQAFTRTDDNRSVPPTPISKQSDTLVSRSNTESTSGISPIMSRVPSSATAALKQRGNAEGSTPAIAEESGDSYMAISQPEPAAANDLQQAPLDAPHMHTRNLSASSLPRTGRATPSSVESPARSPVIEPQSFVAEPESAAVGSASPISPEAMAGGNFAQRESDIALAMKKSPEIAQGLGAFEKDTQAAFLESHHSLPEGGAPRSRSESPSKGRVQELAEKFGDVSQSRRGSTQSNLSKHSIQSWERSPVNSRPSSPTKQESNSRPTTARESSFRPKLPGTWESYATTAPTPSEKGERDFSVENPGPLQQKPIGDLDLTPTTAKHPVAVEDPEKSAADPLATLKAAGAAMGDAIQASIGRGTTSDENEQKKDEESRAIPVGDIYVGDRPVHLERVASSVASSIPPTPPAKDTPRDETPPPPPLKESSPEPSPPSQQLTPVRPTMIAQLSTEPYEDDQESDRLRKEIVASLTPSKAGTAADPNRASLQPNAPDMIHRESSILDSYWEDREEVSPKPLHVQTNVQQQTPVGCPETNPGLLTTRFSWEQPPSQPDNNEGQAMAGATAGAGPGTGNMPAAAAPANQQDTNTAATQASSQFPEPYFGPVHSVASDPVVRSPTPPNATTEQLATPVETSRPQETSPASGLHVVNSALNPEAVDLPPRLSMEGSGTRDPPQYNQADSLASGHAPVDSKIPETQPSALAVPETQSQAPPALATSAPAALTATAPTPKSPTTDKPLGFRDIANIKSHSERLASYNNTREYWANADHGLGDWISSAVAANPELANQTPAPPMPQVTRTGTARHRPAASLSLFGKHHGSKVDQTLANDQPVPMPSSAAAGPDGRPTSSHFGSQIGRSASHQMSSKGKDLLHSAGVLSGKGMTGAKGLFAKGKSRFRSGDKVDK